VVAKIGLPALDEVKARKLKYLTLASLAARHGELEYSLLRSELEIEELRQLEDLVLDAIYQGLIGGKLDQQKQRVLVDFAIGRDVREEDLKQLQIVLSSWCSRATSLVAVIDEKIKVARSELQAEAMQRKDFERRVKEIKENLRAIMEAQEAEQRLQGKRAQGGAGMHPRMQGRPGPGGKQAFF
jgi:COP9 signalosome complex subunit 7